MTDKGFTISELAERAEVTPRTIRYYTSEGLLPAPDTTGRYARYNSDHLNRLRLIARLKAAYLPLHEIRERIVPLDSAAIERALAESTPELPEQPDSAAEYISSVLARKSVAPPVAAAAPPAPVMAAPAPLAEPAPAPAAPPQVERGRVGFFRRLVPGRREENAPAESGESWRRVPLAPGVELHVREPVDASVQEQVRTLIAQARDLFNRD